TRPAVRAGDFQPPYQRQTVSLGRGLSLAPSGHRVVVTPRDHVQPGQCRVGHQLRRAVGPVRGARVGVEVDEHSVRLPGRSPGASGLLSVGTHLGAALAVTTVTTVIAVITAIAAIAD